MLGRIKRLTKEEIKKLKKPYNYAALGDIKKLSKYIEKHQFDVNTPDPNNHDGKTILHYAIESGQLETVKLICAKNPNLNNGSITLPTPLMLALLTQNESIAYALLGYGADPFMESSPTNKSPYDQSEALGKRFELKFKEECDKKNVKVAKVVPKAVPAAPSAEPVDMDHFVVGSRPLPKGFVCPPPGQAIMDEATVKQQEKLFLKTRAMRLQQQQRVERRKKVEYLEDMIQKCNTIYDVMGDWLLESEKADSSVKESEFIKVMRQKRESRMPKKDSNSVSVSRSASLVLFTPRFKPVALNNDDAHHEESSKLLQALRAWTEYDIPDVDPVPVEKSVFKISTKDFCFPMMVNGKQRNDLVDLRTSLLEFSRYIGDLVVRAFRWNDDGFSRRYFNEVNLQINNFANGFVMYNERIKNLLTQESLNSVLSACTNLKESGLALREASLALRNDPSESLAVMGPALTRLVGASVWTVVSILEKSSVELTRRVQGFVRCLLHDQNVKLLVNALSVVNILSSVSFASKTRSTCINLSRSWFNLAKISRDLINKNCTLEMVKEPVTELLQDINDFVMFDVLTRMEGVAANSRDESLAVKESLRLLQSAVKESLERVPEDHYLHFTLDALVLKLSEVEQIAEHILDTTTPNYENKELLKSVLVFSETVESFLKFFSSERQLNGVVQCVSEFTSELILAASCYVLGNLNLPRHQLATCFRSLCYALATAADIVTCMANE